MEIQYCLANTMDIKNGITKGVLYRNANLEETGQHTNRIRKKWFRTIVQTR